MRVHATRGVFVIGARRGAARWFISDWASQFEQMRGNNVIWFAWSARVICRLCKLQFAPRSRNDRPWNDDGTYISRGGAFLLLSPLNSSLHRKYPYSFLKRRSVHLLSVINPILKFTPVENSDSHVARAIFRRKLMNKPAYLVYYRGCYRGKNPNNLCLHREKHSKIDWDKNWRGVRDWGFARGVQNGSTRFTASTLIIKSIAHDDIYARESRFAYRSSLTYDTGFGTRRRTYFWLPFDTDIAGVNLFPIKLNSLRGLNRRRRGSDICSALSTKLKCALV